MKKETRKITSKQVVALAGAAALVLLYLATLVIAIVDSSASAAWFRISLFATLVIPLLIWVYAWMYARLTGRRAAGDPEPAGEP